jgi:uncharacterized membrane protein SpoIIM required for sporulation
MKRALEPRSMQFRREREADWDELAGICARALRRGLRSLPEDDVLRLVVLYRGALSSLAVARRTALDRELVHYLEALAARAYLVVYGSRRPARAAAWVFVTESVPRAVRALAPELALTTAVFLLGVVVAAALVRSDPSWFWAFVDEDYAGGRTPLATTEALRKPLYAGGDSLGTFATFLFTHNARIGMLAFAVGIAAGLPTVLLIFTNGLTLGALLELYAERGLLVPMLGWLLPHGVPEIAAVLLCGAGGLHLGRSLVLPGTASAREALKSAGRRAATVVAGAVLLFAFAGIIEGVFRQVVQDDRARFAMASFNALWLFVWLALIGGLRASSTKAGPAP